LHNSFFCGWSIALSITTPVCRCQSAKAAALFFPEQVNKIGNTGHHGPAKNVMGIGGASTVVPGVEKPGTASYTNNQGEEDDNMFIRCHH